jgi:hypothetical protein
MKMKRLKRLKRLRLLFGLLLIPVFLRGQSSTVYFPVGASQQIKASSLSIAADTTLMGIPDPTIYNTTYTTCLGTPPQPAASTFCQLSATNATSTDLAKRADATILALYNLNPAQADAILSQNKLFLKVN